MKTVAFFNNKGGVGKTSLVYHLAWMFADKGISTLAVDLDPQANLTAMFLSDDRLETLWDNGEKKTISDSLEPLIEGIGDVSKNAYVEPLTQYLGLIPGNLLLSKFEDMLAENWYKCLSGDARAFRVMSAFYRIIVEAARQRQAEVVLVDVGPNLGAINRAALISADYVVLPIAPDLFSLQGLKNLGPTLKHWRQEWQNRLGQLPERTKTEIEMPSGNVLPIGYVVMQHSIRDTRPVKAYLRWLDKMPKVYREAILYEVVEPNAALPMPDKDPYRLALLKHYRSLMPLAMEAHKPMFFLKPADGAIGSHVEAVKHCYDDFLALASRIASKINLVFE